MSDLFGPQPALLAPDGAKGQKERGAFYTPDALALAICRSLHAQSDLFLDGKPGPRRIFEPGCGGGAFLRAAAATWPAAQIYGVDLVPACKGPGEVEKRNLFEVTERFDLVVGNPDFAVAERVVRHCMTLLRPNGVLALLLRLSFLAGQGRAQLYADHPLRVLQPVAGRPSFSGDGRTDPIEYGLFVWARGFRGTGEVLQPLTWK